MIGGCRRACTRATCVISFVVYVEFVLSEFFSLYKILSPRKYSQHCFIAMNSAPKELVSTLVCFFEYQKIGALFRKIMNPVLDLRLVVSVA